MRSVHGISATLSGLICLMSIAGCGSGSKTSGGGGGGGKGTGGGASPANSLYATQVTPSSPASVTSNILQFSRTGSGSVTPTLTIAGPAGVQFGALTIDSSGSLYVGGSIYASTCNSPGAGGSEVVVYAPGATGMATPARTITGSLTELQSLCTNPIQGIDIDPAGNVYVASAVAVGSGPSGRIYSGILAFSPTANGNVAPARYIAGPLTTIFSPQQIAVDSAGAIYVAGNTTVNPAGPGSVLMFNSTATGNAVPAGALSGANTTMYNVEGVAVDSAKNIYVASISQDPSGGVSLNGTPSILVFSPGATGNVAPVRTISGSATTMGQIASLRVDSAGNIYVLSDVAGPTTTILVFSPTASGNVAPTMSMTSSALFESGDGIAVQ